MKINDIYSVSRVDKYNYVIQKTSTGKNRKIYKRVQGYYSTLESACLRALDLQINTQDLETIITSIQKAKEEIVEAIKNKKQIV